MSRFPVLVNAIHAKSGGGVTYLRALLPRLAADSALEVHLAIGARERPLFEPIPGAVLVHAVAARPFLAELAWEQLVLPRLARRLGVRATFSLANFGPLLAPRPVVLLSNLLAVGREEHRPGKRLYWGALALMTALSLATSARAIAVSAFARERLGFNDRLRRKVTVIPHGVEPVFFVPGPRPPDEGFLLAVGDLYVQKNYLALVDAFARIAPRRPGLELKIAGAPVDSGYAGAVRRRIAALGLEGRVRLLGRQDRDALIDLYRRAALFVLPSTVESFGMPLLEAMAAGAPVACARASALPEVAGEAALYFDPHDPRQIAAAIERALDEPGLKERLGAAGRARARAFDWERTARATIDLLKEAGGAAPPGAAAGWLEGLAWAWVGLAFAAYLAQFRGLAGPVLAALGLG
ncbi:MAG: glycosyltransferase family 4 protein [Proteobacteria bacterium]|nr:glycosyltransferase family 4 protein [Pseudomonadota bacterium]